MMSLKILILDDEAIVGERLGASLEKDGHQLEAYTDPNEAIKSLNENLFDIVITDIRMDDIDGIKILELVREKSPKTKVIMITGYATLEVARESLTKGAFDFIAKPFKIKEIKAAIEKAAQALQKEDGD
jgi:DNA-binding NtrC family response regulator